MNSTKGIVVRVYFIYIFVLIAMIFILIKSVMIIMDGRASVFESSSSKIKQRSAFVEPKRGEILDANGGPLVTSVSSYDIYMDPTVVSKSDWDSDLESLTNELAIIFKDKTAAQYELYLRNARIKKRRYVLIQKSVSNEDRRKLKQFPIFKLGRFKGGLIDNKVITQRKMPHDELLKRTLGYVKVNNSDTILIGIEGAFDKYLAGQPGEVLEQLISNSWKPTGSVIRESREGFDVVTSIDKEIQEVAHAELENQLKLKGGTYGCAIVMEVKTGFIKAIVNLQEDASGNYKELFNHAIATREVPGSTMKLASLMAALEDKKIKISDTVNAAGRYQFYNQKLTDSKPQGYGKISIQRAFEVSSNVISKVIYNNYKDNPDEFLNRLESFGILQPLNLELKGESSPIYSNPENDQWWGGSLAWLSIGYEIQLTPLQLLSFYNAVANDGKYMKPQFVMAVKQGRQVIEQFEPIVLREKICSQETIEIMKNCLEGVVERGTGSQLKSYFKTAGKTGTAQIANNNLGYGNKNQHKYIASFAGYFPAEDPIYSCIVVIAAPTNDIYGASVSGTVFTSIANKVYATSLKYHQAVNETQNLASIPTALAGSNYELGIALNSLNIQTKGEVSSDWVEAVNGNNDIQIERKYFKMNTIPDVRGMGLKDALLILEDSGLRVKSTGLGKVAFQSLSPGVNFNKGQQIEIILSY
jgi:cell division protein FtsI (penicillin-binding protein 3)